MKEYVIKRINNIPDWHSIPVMPIDHQRGENKGQVTAQAQLCWDDFGIHVRLAAKEKHIRKKLTGMYESVCRDSCLEFFLRPTGDPHYMNFEFNPNGALWLGLNTGKHDMIRLVAFKYKEILRPVITFPKGGGWEIIYTIPFSFIQTFFHDFQPKSGLEFTGNCYKCGEWTRHPHHLMWNPIPDGLSFHEPAHFGKLILE